MIHMSYQTVDLRIDFYVEQRRGPVEGRPATDDGESFHGDATDLASAHARARDRACDDVRRRDRFRCGGPGELRRSSERRYAVGADRAIDIESARRCCNRRYRGAAR